MIMWIFYSFIVVLLVYLWEKRRLLYYASKINGPFAVPLIGSFVLLTLTKKNFLKVTYKTFDAYRPICKLWAGPNLYFITSRPTDVEIILTTCLSKSSFYDKFNEFIRDSLLTLKVDAWKEHRKIINPTFNKKNLDSLHPIFIEYVKKMVKFLDREACNVQINFMNTIWEKTFDIGLESLMDVEPDTFEDRYFALRAALIGGHLFIQRFYKFWLLLDFFWKFSSLRKEQERIMNLVRVRQQTILLEWEKGHEPESEDTLRCKRFLPHLMKLSNQTKQITRDEILNETLFMIVAASETTAAAVNTVFTVLGILHDVQEKVYEELFSVLLPVKKEPTIEDINRLDYLERVIKESMRIFPVVPFIMRSVERDMHLDPYLFPAGCEVIIPIAAIHRDPDVWPDPEKFDPDRFLPEEISKRHRGSYIPFSYGARNCIGLKYAMRSMKVMLAMVLGEFRVKTVGMKSLEDIEWEYYMTTKPTKNHLVFEKRMP